MIGRILSKLATPDDPIVIEAGDGLSLLGVTETSNGTRVISRANHELLGLVAFERQRRNAIAQTNFRRYG